MTRIQLRISLGNCIKRWHVISREWAYVKMHVIAARPFVGKMKINFLKITDWRSKANKIVHRIARHILCWDLGSIFMTIRCNHQTLANNATFKGIAKKTEKTFRNEIYIRLLRSASEYAKWWVCPRLTACLVGPGGQEWGENCADHVGSALTHASHCVDCRPNNICCIDVATHPAAFYRTKSFIFILCCLDCKRWKNNIE